MGSLRIIAGELKGRRITVPRLRTVRPTADRVREALFSILGPAVVDARVMDAYSGSGALGFEALSRGALRSVFLESNRQALETLRRNASRLGVGDRCTFLQGRVSELLRGKAKATRGPFDLILADPPYAARQAEPFLSLAARRLDPAGLIVLERDARIEPPAVDPLVLQRFRTATYGGSCLDFYRRPTPHAGGVAPTAASHGSG